MEDNIDFVRLVNLLPPLYVRYELALRGVDYFPLTVEAKKQRLVAILRQEAEQNVCRLTFASVLSEQTEIEQCRDEFNIILGQNTNTAQYSLETARACLYFLRDRIIRINGGRDLRELYTRAVNLVAMNDRRNEATNLSASLRQAFVFDLTSTSRGLDSPDFSGFNLSDPEPPRPNRSPPPSDLPLPSFGQGRYALLGSNTNPFLDGDLERRHVPAVPPRRFPAERRVVSNSTDSQRERIWQWDIKFTGDDPKSSASEFLQVLMDRSISRNVSRENILYSMTDLLGGTALKWFRSETHIQPFPNWQEFVRKFLEDFEPNHLNDGLLETISNRRQLQEESVVKYFSDVENMFWRLHAVPEEPKRVSIIRKNLLPHLVQSLSLYEFNTVASLKEACKKIELGYQLSKQNYSNVRKYPTPQLNTPENFNRYPNTNVRPAYAQRGNTYNNNNFGRQAPNYPGNQLNANRWPASNQNTGNFGTRFQNSNQNQPPQYRNYNHQTVPQNSRQINSLQCLNYEFPVNQCLGRSFVANNNPYYSQDLTNQGDFFESNQPSAESASQTPIQERPNLINVDLTTDNQASISENLNGAGLTEPTPTSKQ